MRKRVRYVGRVQGVGFRARARSFAARIGVSGWVKNEPDGSVLMEVQGLADDVETVMLSIAAEMGSYIASADAVDMLDVPGESGFQIVRSL